MFSGDKELIIVLVIAGLTFQFSKPIALLYSSPQDFSRRRNIWFVLTTAAFLIPSFWGFCLIAVPLLWWGGRKDLNPIALYALLLFVIPPVQIPIPSLLGHEFFDIDIFRLLSFFVLAPTAYRLFKSQKRNPSSASGLMDALLLGFGVLQLFLYVRPQGAILPDSLTAALRRGFLFFLDSYLLYYVVSRYARSPRQITEIMAALCLSCIVMAPMAMFEALRHWLLYDVTVTNLSRGVAQLGYLARNGVLRAQVSAGHSLTLGYLLAMALGSWLFLKDNVRSPFWKMCPTVILCMALLACYSRGPWLTAIVTYFVFVFLGPEKLSRLFKAGLVALIVIGVILVSPVGDKVMAVLPFAGGSVDVGSILYRERLAERSLEVIQQHPFFGDQFVYMHMTDLIQGQGIIDFVNTYAQIALYYGLVGLSLFLFFFLCGMYRAYRAAIACKASDLGLSTLGMCLVACMIGTLVMLATASFGLATERIYYLLGGLAAAYANVRFSDARQTDTARRPHSYSQVRTSLRRV